MAFGPQVPRIGKTMPTRAKLRDDRTALDPGPEAESLHILFSR